MTESCTCGAQLPENARFCHRCGKPQWEPEVEEPTVAPPASPPAAAARPHIAAVSFHNPIAVRTALLVASLAVVLDALPYVDLLCLFWSVAAGFLAVVLYKRRSGQSLTVRGGAKLGWITGVMIFAMLTVLVTVTLLSSGANVMAEYREQMAAMAAKDPSYLQAMRVLDNPVALVCFLLLTLAIMFAIFAAACVAGGALGAKVSQNE